MKKLLSVFLSLLLLLGAVPAFADTTESELVAKLILTAKNKLSISDDELEFARYYAIESKTDKSYNLFWQGKNPNVYLSVSATLNEAGEILDYYKNFDRGDGSLRFPKFSRDQAAEAARAFLQTVAPERLLLCQLVPVEKPRYGEYAVSFQRMEGGVPVWNQRLFVSVDAETLEVLSFHASWANLTFPEGEFVSRETAEQAFRDKLGYGLFYQVQSEQYENSVQLIYRSRYDENLYIDAFTGEVMLPEKLEELYRGDMENSKNEAADSIMGSMGGATLSPEEQALVDQVSAMLSKEKADKIVRGIPEFGFTEDFILESHRVNRRPDGTYVISLSYGYEKEEGGARKNLVLAAESGKVLSYNGYTYSADVKQAKEPVLSDDEAKAKAEAFLEKYYREEWGNMLPKERFGEASGCEYLRVVNGIPVYNNGARLYYDSVSGELSSFSLDWTVADFPAQDAVAGKDAADEKAMVLGSFGLRYLAAGGKGVPVYGLEERPVLDAVTLSELDYRLKPVAKDEAPVYQDLSGHYAEAAIGMLSDFGIYLADSDGKLLPDSPISQKDYLLLLDKLLWNGRYARDTEELYRYVIQRGILAENEKAPEATVNRISALRWLLLAMDYGKVLDMPEVFRQVFCDISGADTSVAAIAYGLGLVRGDGEHFYPDKNLTRAEALTIIYNYLK
ncbi:MAG: S-layer homology domain-containing protein [Clostridia bacterium]|nr:S-layer homology domain-containing protein [Clostridia bacterium]